MITLTRSKHELKVIHPGFTGQIGVARRDITPPVGIYSRMWGSALHDVAEGVHLPLTATVIALRSNDADAPLILVCLDLGWWRSPTEERLFRTKVLQSLSLSESQLILHLSHTHSGPSISLEAKEKPGGDKIKPYLDNLHDAVVDATREALDSCVPSILEWSTGRCDLAHFRDQPNPEGKGMVVGYCPEVEVDDTLLVGRVSSPTRGVMATLVNYACHPTTLGGSNRLISPDYVGPMRELVEEHTGAAPCLFLNGAAGDLAPRQQYVGDMAVAVKNGHQLGHAVLSVLSGMLPSGSALEFDRVEESGTELGRWHATPHSHAGTFRRYEAKIHLSYKQTPQLDQLQLQLEECNDRVRTERMERMNLLHSGFNENHEAEFTVWIWIVGAAVFIGLPGEMHSPFQLEMRKIFPDNTIVVMNLANGIIGYLPPKKDFPLETYQAQISPFAPGCHERVLADCAKIVAELLAESPAIQDQAKNPSGIGRNRDAAAH